MEVREPSAKYLAKRAHKQTDVGLVPEDWDVVPLRQLAEKIMVGIASAATHAYRDRGVVMFRNQNIKPGYLDDTDILYIAEDYERVFKNKRLKAGDLITARTGYPGTTSIVPKQYEGSQSFTTLITRPRCGSVDSDFLCHFINSEAGQRYFDQAQIGGGQKNVNAGALKNLPVCLPPTLAEQQAIAEALSDADALIEALEQLLAKKRQIKQGAMQEVLIGKRRLPGYEQKQGYEATEIGSIPRDWQVMSLLSAVRVAEGQVSPMTEPYKSMILVGPVHVESCTGKLLCRQTAEEQGAISGKYLFADGDIVYGKINPYLQKAFLADFGGLCSADMYPLRPVKGISGRFMLAVILGHRFTAYAVSVSVRSGMPKINRAELNDFVFAIPRSIDEQESIGGTLSDMDAEISALEAKLTKARGIKQGMMQELLTGRIRLV